MANPYFSSFSSDLLADIVLKEPSISDRHCLIYLDNTEADEVAQLEDLSDNGTFVNEALVGRNKHKRLKENDKIAVSDNARFIFRYGTALQASNFDQDHSNRTVLLVNFDSPSMSKHYISQYRLSERDLKKYLEAIFQGTITIKV